MKKPGQFVHVKVDDCIDPLLRRPISICDVDLIQEELTMIYRAEGNGTKQLSALKQAGETVNVLGPLGNGFPTDVVSKGTKGFLVGGGVGVPPLIIFQNSLLKRVLK